MELILILLHGFWVAAAELDAREIVSPSFPPRGLPINA